MAVDTTAAHDVSAASVPTRNRALFQILLMGAGLFCIPGGFNAITGIAGGVDAAILAEANVWLYFVFGICSVFVPALVNILGPRVCMVVGSLGYPWYVLCLFMVGKKKAWSANMMIAGGVGIGVGAALLWVGEGTLTYAYATPEERGTFWAIVWVVFNTGGMLCDLGFGFGLNLVNHSPEPADMMYYLFMGVMLVGTLICACLAPPSKVVRKDGKSVHIEQHAAIVPELVGMLKLMLDPRALALIPMMLYTNWCYNVQLNQYGPLLFTLPTKGLAAALYWGMQLIGAFLIARFQDAPGQSLRSRATKSFVVASALTLLPWILGAFAFSGAGYDLDNRWVLSGHGNQTDKLDLIAYDEGRFVLPLLLFMLWGLSDSLIQSWVSWALGQLSDEAQILSRFAGIYKVFNSFGNMTGSLANSWSPVKQLWLVIGLYVISIPASAWVISTLKTTASVKDPLVNSD